VDGIALDVHGDVYVASPEPLFSSLVRVSADDGSFEILASEAAGIVRPTSVVFGTGRGEKQSVYVTNFAGALGSPFTAGSVVKVDVGVPGWPDP
jgi:hypothetical protein